MSIESRLNPGWALLIGLVVGAVGVVVADRVSEPEPDLPKVVATYCAPYWDLRGEHWGFLRRLEGFEIGYPVYVWDDGTRSVPEASEFATRRVGASDHVVDVYDDYCIAAP